MTKYIPYIDWPYEELKKHDLIYDSGYGLDYHRILGIDAGCIYSVWCGMSDGGRLFLLDEWKLIPCDCFGEYELEVVKKWWEENKSKYKQFKEKKKRTITYRGCYEPLYVKFCSTNGQLAESKISCIEAIDGNGNVQRLEIEKE